MNKYERIESIHHYYCPLKEKLFPINSDGSADLKNGRSLDEFDNSKELSAFDLGKLELCIDHSGEE